MFKKENLSNLKVVVVTCGIFCYIMYTCIPIVSLPNNFEDSSMKPVNILYEEQNTTNHYGLNFELKYGIKYIIFPKKLINKDFIFFSNKRREKQIKKNVTHQRHNSICEHSMDLPLINDIDITKVQNSIMMLETSGDTWLIAR